MMQKMRLSTSSSSVLRYLVQALLFGVLVIVFQAALFVLLPRNPYSYHLCYMKKLASLAQAQSPKVVCVGGSSMAFSMDSEWLEKELGMPVVNTAHHAGLGLLYMLNSVDPVLSAGDIVVFSAEYEHFDWMPWTGDGTLVELLFEDPRTARYLSAPHIIPVLRGHVSPIKSRVRHLAGKGGKRIFERGPVYNESACNQHGDVTSHLGMAFGHHIPRMRLAGGPDENRIRMLGEALHRWERKGVLILLAPPAIRESDFNANAEWIRECLSLFERHLPCQQPFLLEDSFFPRDFFFDTKYHLTREGRQLRTRQVLGALREMVQESASQGTLPNKVP